MLRLSRTSQPYINWTQKKVSFLATSGLVGSGGLLFVLSEDQHGSGGVAINPFSSLMHILHVAPPSLAPQGSWRRLTSLAPRSHADTQRFMRIMDRLNRNSTHISPDFASSSASRQSVSASDGSGGPSVEPADKRDPEVMESFNKLILRITRFIQFHTGPCRSKKHNCGSSAVWRMAQFFHKLEQAAWKQKKDLCPWMSHKRQRNNKHRAGRTSPSNFQVRVNAKQADTKDKKRQIHIDQE